jgi:hypothetical protein
LGALCFGTTAGSWAAKLSSRQTTLFFSGYTWTVKSSAGIVGPGPNYFSDSSDNVWVDAAGQLHLRITFANGHWNCAEVVNSQSLGYGTYTFRLANSSAAVLDPNATLGLFTWSDQPQYLNREIDIEFARWANAADPTTGQYVVQPYDAPGHLRRITQVPLAPATASFTWRKGSVSFTSPGSDTPAWTYNGSDVPRAGGENARMNLWLFHGQPPTDGLPVEVVVKSFTFAPLHGPASTNG